MESENMPLLPSVADQMQQEAPGRMFVFVPFHPVPVMEFAYYTQGNYDGVMNNIKSERKFNEWKETQRNDPTSLVNFWDKRYREGLQLIKDQLGPVEGHEYARKVPQVVVFGDNWSDASHQLKTAGPNDTVYVVGHSSDSLDSLYNGESAADLAKPLNASNLLDRMHAQGIPQTVGKIKIFACSAAANENAFVPKFVQASRDNKRYADSHVVGYTKDVSYGIDRIERVANSVNSLAQNQTSMQKSVDDLNMLLTDEHQLTLDQVRGVGHESDLDAAALQQPEDLEQAEHHVESVREKLKREKGLQKELGRRLDKRAGMKLANMGVNGDGEVQYDRASNHAVDYAPRQTEGVRRPVVVAPPVQKRSCGCTIL